jgi:HAE1 family hydrophobic/amphiphilic exporter-1
VVSGNDISTLNAAANQVRDLLDGIPGVTDVQQIQVEGLPEIQLKIDKLLAGQFGITAKNVGDSLATWVQGDTTNYMQIGDDNVPIDVRLKGGDRAAPGEIVARNFYTKDPTTRADVGVSLLSIARPEPGSGTAIINRENRQRIVRIGANLTPGAALGDIVTALQAKLDGFPFPQGLSARIVGQAEQMNELFTNVLWATGIGTLFVYMVLVSLFESFLQPIAVMAAIPLAATGAVLALLAFGQPLDLYGGVGMILLAGIVAKNSILLVDFAVQRVREGLPARDAILEAAPLRLRPIIMTSVAMIAGMVPVAMGLGSGGAARRTLGIATIGGVVSSTFLTLLVVPSLYLMIDWGTRAWARRRGVNAAPGQTSSKLDV